MALTSPTESVVDDGWEHRDYDDEDRHREYVASFPDAEGCDRW